MNHSPEQSGARTRFGQYGSRCDGWCRCSSALPVFGCDRASPLVRVTSVRERQPRTGSGSAAHQRRDIGYRLLQRDQRQAGH